MSDEELTYQPIPEPIESEHGQMIRTTFEDTLRAMGLKPPLNGKVVYKPIET